MMADKNAEQLSVRRHAGDHTPDARVPSEASLALLFDIRRRVILSKPGLVTDSGETLRQMRAGDAVTPYLPASALPRRDDYADSSPCVYG